MNNSLYYASFVVVVPVVVGVAYFRRMPPAGRIFTIILVSYLAVEIIALISKVAFSNNRIVYFLYVPVMMSLFGSFFYNATSDPSAHRWIFAGTILAAALPIAEILADVPLTNGYSFGLVSLVVFSGTIYLFYEMALGRTDHKAYWLNLFTFFAFFVAAGYFIAGRYIRQSDVDALVMMSNTQDGVNTVCYLGYAYGLKHMAS